MALTTLLFVGVYMFCLLGSMFFHPLLGVIGYAMTYNISPASQWWGVDLAQMGFRYSFFMGAAIAIGMFFHKDKLAWPKGLHRQEVLFLVLIAWIFLTTFTGLPGVGVENFGIKLFKVALFLWMLGRIVTDLKKYETFLWALILIGLYLGYDALGVSTAAYGRLHSGIGGSDFSEGNFLAAHFGMLLPFIGAFFLQGGRYIKLMLLVTSVFVVNGIILCRSRGIFVAIAVGLVAALWYSPKEYRGKIVALLLIGAIGSFFLVDQGFIERMQRINLDITNIEEQDSSTAGRIMAWKAAFSMASDYPLMGIGQGNFSSYVGNYQPEIPGKDTHNTYLRNLAELGFPGLILFLMMIWTAFQTLRKSLKRIEGFEREATFRLHIFAIKIALVIFLTAGMFITHTYIEELYWLLFFPVLLERAINNESEKEEFKQKFDPVVDSDIKFPKTEVRI